MRAHLVRGRPPRTAEVHGTSTRAGRPGGVEVARGRHRGEGGRVARSARFLKLGRKKVFEGTDAATSPPAAPAGPPAPNQPPAPAGPPASGKGAVAGKASASGASGKGTEAGKAPVGAKSATPAAPKAPADGPPPPTPHSEAGVDAPSASTSAPAPASAATPPPVPPPTAADRTRTDRLYLASLQSLTALDPDLARIAAEDLGRAYRSRYGSMPGAAPAPAPGPARDPKGQVGASGGQIVQGEVEGTAGGREGDGGSPPKKKRWGRRGDDASGTAE
jgi:hypothetical protein